MPAPVRQCIVDVPSPGRDHREDEPSAFREQIAIDVRIEGGDGVRHVRDVELDRTSATGFEVDETQAVLGAEQVARMRFAVQQLLGRSTVVDPSTRAAQGVCEEAAIGVGERGRRICVGDQTLGRCDTIREVRRRDLDASHPRVQTVQRAGVVSRR